MLSPESADAEPEELAVEGARDGPGDGGLAHAGGTAQAHNLALKKTRKDSVIPSYL